MKIVFFCILFYFCFKYFSSFSFSNNKTLLTSLNILKDNKMYDILNYNEAIKHLKQYHIYKNTLYSGNIIKMNNQLDKITFHLNEMKLNIPSNIDHYNYIINAINNIINISY